MKTRDIEQAVARAYGAAKEMSERQDTTLVTYEDAITNNDVGYLGQLRDAPDHAQFVDFQSVIPEPNPNEIVVLSPEELLHAILYLSERYCGGAIPEDVMRTSVEHESQHAHGARLVGFQASRYSLSIGNVTQEGEKGSVSWYASHTPYFPDHYPTKLEVASVIAQPLRPSTGDEADLRAMGYEGGSHEVTARILGHNYYKEKQLPVPLFCELDAA